MSIGKKITLLIVGISLVLLVVSFFVLNSFKSGIAQGVYEETKAVMSLKIEDRVDAKLDAGISNAVAIANDANIAKALENNDRNLAIKTVKSISDKYKSETSYKNAKVHIHDKDIKSFLRNWEPEKFGDDLASFRHTIKKVKTTKKSLYAIEVGNSGLTFRGLTPIVKDDNYLGSLEFILGFDSIVKQFSTEKENLLILMDDKLAHLAKLADTSKKVSNYILSQKGFDEKFFKAAQKINTNELLEKGFVLDNDYFYTYATIKDFDGNSAGIYLLGKDRASIEKAVIGASNIINTALIMIIILIIALAVTIIVAIRKVVITPLKNINDSLSLFFSLLNRETTKAELIKLDSKDEFGEMAVIINENITNIEKSIIADKQMIGNTQAVMNRVKNGWYSEFIEAIPASNELDVLKQTLNEMIKANRARFLEIDEILEAYANHNYTPSAHLNPTDEKDGILERLIIGLNAMQTSITEMLSNSLQNGIDLQSDASTLKQAVETLSTASNQQAASLEETAAAMEEMTSNVQNNVQKSNEMATMANQTDSAAKDGAELAKRTSTAMTEIQTATNSINDAVAIIENIAFQTNILSLNAAVEAATAGDAGKGFAVVAQEVRNLANRSADAAKEIKTMAALAANKSNEGMNIATELTRGFEVIADKIAQTASMVQDVSNANKEQMQGIGQINTAVTQLDQMTQENAKIAAQADSIANATIQKAEAMVKDALSKEFVGKSNISATQSSTTGIKATRTSKLVQAAKPVVAKQKYASNAIAKNSSKHESDVWESF